ncbi:MAG: B12-binding domain-containing radical SAM protein [bacterium]|nr:B12-binding domain-containing radical SAM protein [bacterium]
MNICFIHASYYPVKGKLSQGSKAWIYGITLPLLSAYIDKKHSVSIINDAVHPLPDKNDYDVIFISVMGSALDRTKEIALALKTETNSIIAGGKTLNETSATIAPHVDSVVLGEAESLMPQIMRDIENNTLKKEYGDKNLRSSIADLPLPRYDLIDTKHHGFIYPVEATRGCPNNCSYCYVAAWSKCDFKKRPIDQVVRDIQYLKKMDIDRILFVDDNICADRDYAIALFKELEKLGIKWICQITAQAIADEELMTMAARSGLFAVTIGFESMTKENLESVNKKNEPGLYEKGIRILHALDIYTFPMFMIGFDFNIEEELQKIHDFCLANQVTAPLLYILTPPPGTPLYEKYISENKIDDTDLSNYNLFHIVFKPHGLSKEELKQSFWSTYQSLYSYKNIFKRILFKKTPLKQKLIQLFINLFLHKNIKNQNQLHLDGK